VLPSSLSLSPSCRLLVLGVSRALIETAAGQGKATSSLRFRARAELWKDKANPMLRGVEGGSPGAVVVVEGAKGVR
jgi:hypothetical protein